MSDPTVIDSFRPLAAVTISLVGMILVMVFSERRRLRIGCILLAAIGQFLIVASMIPGVASGVEYETALGVLVADIDFVPRADPFGMIYALVASGLYVVTVIYAVGYLEATHSTEKAGRVPRGRLEIEDFHDDETLCVSNHLPPRVNAVRRPSFKYQ